MESEMSYQANIGREPAPSDTALDGVRRQIDEITNALSGLHAIADRAFGALPPVAQNKPSVVPNGLMDQIEDDMGGLSVSAQELLKRMRRLA
jgi:hypothetical protein